MNQKPTGKQLLILNLGNNLPMALVMSIAAPLLSHAPLVPQGLLINTLIGFVLACIINAVLPIPKMVEGFPKLFKMDPFSVPGRFIGNIPVCFIFVVIIGLVLTAVNLGFAGVPVVPTFIFAFMSTFLPLYVICYIISMITNPITQKLAFGK